MTRPSAGSGSVTRELVRFSIPLILSAILQQLYNWADALIVGNVEGELALGAIGGTGTITGFFLLLINGLAVGIGVLAAQKFGSGDVDYLSDILSAFVLILTTAYLALAALGLAAARPILALISTPDATIGLASDYLRIIMLGMPFLAVYNTFSAVIRATGDSKVPFYAVLISSVVNVLLDLVLVAGLRWGIRGVAAATVLSQALMTVFMCVYARKRHPELRLNLSPRALRPEVIRRGFALGIPPMLQSSVTALGSMVLQSFMNGFGAATVIAITTAYRIDTLAMLPVINTASAISTLSAQGYGARDAGRIRQVRRAGVQLMLVVSAALTGLVIPFGGRLIALFGAGPEAIAIGQAFFARLASFYVVFGLYNALRGYLQGIGDVGFMSLMSILSLGVRVVCSYAFAGLWGNMVIAYAEGISWVFALVVCLVRMRKFRRLAFPAQTAPGSGPSVQ